LEAEDIIYTVHHGCNSGLIKSAVKLYFGNGSKIADVTYGRGVFWKDINKKQYEIIGTDIKTGIDFKKLPYMDNTFDHSVIDPPYARLELKGMQNCYNTTRYITHNNIVEMYRAGLSELKRITRRIVLTKL
jgi:tRNA G10  N-methylase Trm11